MTACSRALPTHAPYLALASARALFWDPSRRELMPTKLRLGSRRTKQRLLVPPPPHGGRRRYSDHSILAVRRIGRDDIRGDCEGSHLNGQAIMIRGVPTQRTISDSGSPSRQ